MTGIINPTSRFAPAGNIINLASRRFAKLNHRDHRGMVTSFHFEPLTPEQMHGLLTLFGLPATISINSPVESGPNTEGIQRK